MDCSRNSSRQPGCWPCRSSVSVSRNIALAGPGSSAPIASHGCSASASSSSSRGSASNRPSGPVRAVSQASSAGTCFGRRPRQVGSRSISAGNLVRTPASVNAHSAEVASTWPSWESGSARHTGGIAAISEFSAKISGPCTTGRQSATGPCSSQDSAGSTRPRSTRSRANAARSARYPRMRRSAHLRQGRPMQSTPSRRARTSGNRPGQQNGFDARCRARGRPGTAAVSPAATSATTATTDRSTRLTGVDQGDGIGGRSEWMRACRTQRFAAARHREGGILRPQAEPIRRGPEPMYDQHRRILFRRMRGQANGEDTRAEAPRRNLSEFTKAVTGGADGVLMGEM